MSGTAEARRLSVVGRHVAAAADKPDIGAPHSAWGRARMEDEAGAFVIAALTPAMAGRPLLSDPVTGWGTVTRGTPPGHLLDAEQRRSAGLTAATWSLDVAADPFVDPPHVRAAAMIGQKLAIDLPALRALGAAHGTVKVIKAMQCLNVDPPLGQGVWEGVPLATVLRQCGRITNCRRIYYWGFHNDDPLQVFRSSVSYTEAFEPVPGEPPVFLAYALNGKPLPIERGGPVRMIVPWAHGFKSVKFLQHIRLTNDYRPNDTYAAIDEGDEGNDPGSVQKTYTIVDQMRGAPAIPRGGTVRLSGVLTNGRTPCSHLEYLVRGPDPKLARAPVWAGDDPALLAGRWVRFEVPAPPSNLAELLTSAGAAAPADVFGIDLSGVPRRWPLPFSYAGWAVDVAGLAPGVYQIYARAVDEAGNTQPEPRPAPKNGRNTVGARRVRVL